MKNLLGIVALCGLLGLGLDGIVLANGALAADEAPDIPASAVVSSSLDLNGVAPTSVYVDNLGHIAAKFAVASLGLAPGQATLTLCGDLKTGDSFSASDVVTVK